MVRLASAVVARRGAIVEWGGASPFGLAWSCRSRGHPVCRHDTHVLLTTPARGRQDVNATRGGLCARVLLVFSSGLCLSVKGPLRSIDVPRLRVCGAARDAATVPRSILCRSGD